MAEFILQKIPIPPFNYNPVVNIHNDVTTT